MMKKIIFSLLMISLVLLTACQKSEPQVSSSGTDIEDEDLSADLEDLESLENQGNDLDNVGFEELEELDLK